MRHKRLKKKVVYILIIIIIIIVVLTVLLIFNQNEVKVELIGDYNIKIKVGNEYVDDLFNLVDNNNNVKLADIEYEISTDLDINTLGEYTYKYIIKYNHKEYRLTRIIDVIDDTPPEIIIDETLLKNNVCNVSNNKEIKAIDNYDGDITNKVTKEVMKDGINYRVSDSSNNVTEVFKKIDLNDKVKPTLTLSGDKSLYVDNKKEGTYTITYTISDASSNKTSNSRTVTVISQKNLDIINKKKEIENYITNNKYKVSVLYYDLNSDYKYGYKENTVYFGASLIKTLAALYAYEKMDLTKEIKDLVKPTIEVSNNTTYSKLVNKIGVNNLKKYGISLGAQYVKNLSDGNKYVNTTAEEQLIFWKKVWSFVNTSEKGEELKSYFINNTTRYLDFDGSPEIMHKYGLANGCFHDTGIVLDSNPYIVLILTKEGYGKYSKIVNDLSKKVYELHKLVNSK